ncbi:MAG: 2-hydroxyacyl-CoA dehydratase family protein [Chloroflexi bacterium]|nr:2-hydroxyacyl-CoA dehydratase family protein [Chloroflexota bacterium]
MLDNLLYQISEQRKQELNDLYYKRGRLVITYFPFHTPLELLEASGVEYLSWPWYVQLYGYPERYVRDRITDLYLPAPPFGFCMFSRTNFTLNVKYPRPEIRFVHAYTCDAYTKMWEYMEKDFPVYYFNLPREDPGRAFDYWYAQVEDFKKYLEKISGQPIDDQAMAAAIERERQIREKLRWLSARRGPAFKSSHAYTLLTMRHLLGQGAYLQLLDNVISMVQAEEGHPKNLFCLAGSFFEEPSPTTMPDVVTPVKILEFCEENGCTTIESAWIPILVEDGIGQFGIEPSADPLRQIARDSLERYPHPAITDTHSRAQAYIDLAKQSGARGMFFMNYQGCRLYLVESHWAQSLAEKQGIPYHHIQTRAEEAELPDLLNDIRTFITIHQATV